MHELGIMKHVVKTVFEATISANATEVKSVTLIVGELRNFQPKWIQFYYDMLTEGSAAAGAKIIVENVPATACCLECGEIYKANPEHGGECIVCPGCGSDHYEFCTGNEMILKSIEIGGEGNEEKN